MLINEIHRHDLRQSLSVAYELHLTVACLYYAACLNWWKLKDDFEAKENEMKMAKISYEAAIDQVCDNLSIENYESEPLLANPRKLIQIFFRNFSFPGCDTHGFLEN